MLISTLPGHEQVKSDEEALRLMNDSPYGLTASVWTNDDKAFEALTEDLDVGTVFMNRSVLPPPPPPNRHRCL